MAGGEGNAHEQVWSPEIYASNAGFVPALGDTVLGWLAPGPGERILDLGCGDGVLTERIVQAGATAFGVDASPAFVEAARARGIHAAVMDARDLAFDEPFDAVFTNAALHWIAEAGRVAAGVFAALVPGGRFVGEMGGHGNVAAIATALRAVAERHGLPPELAHPWYFPTAAEYAAVLEAAGFRVEEIALVPRPTPLPTGIRGWIRTFRQPLFDAAGARDTAVLDDLERLLAPSLRDESGNWTADYVRLRFRARRPGRAPRAARSEGS